MAFWILCDVQDERWTKSSTTLTTRLNC